MSADRPFLGILLMLGFCLLVPLADAVAKHLGTAVALVTLVAARMSVQAGLLAPLCLATGRTLTLRGSDAALAVLRAALQIAGIGLMFLSLRYLPLADAVAIAFVMPFFILLLGWQVLGEQVGARRLLACAVGFMGTLMVVQPSFAEVGLRALLPIAVAAIFAVFILVTRVLARRVDPIVLQAYGGLAGSVVLLPLAALWGFGAAEHAGWLLLLGCLGTAAHLLMTWSLTFAPASTLAPMQYLEIPVAAALGWIIFREFPDGLALAGIVVTIAAGLYIIARERRLARPQAPPPPPPAPPAAE